MSENYRDKKVLLLNEHWRFQLEEGRSDAKAGRAGSLEEAWYKGYDDSHWQEVTLPHDWSVSYPFSTEYSSGTGYLAGGTGWYRLRFKLPEACRDKSIRVVFDGIYKNSQVWCNSYYLGKRPNGYVSFSYDITEYAEFGETDNVLSIKVTHMDLADSRWFTGSGITRKVTLEIEEKVHLAHYGTSFITKSVAADAAQATVAVTHEIENTRSQEVQLKAETIFKNSQAEPSLSLQQNICLPPHATGQLVLAGVMESPKLWSDREPNLYTMETWFTLPGQEAYLAGTQKIGIRSIRFDAKDGFFLNEVPAKLKGVCVHHDGGCLGAAMTKEVWQRRLRLLKQAGTNAIRCSHNPHMPELYELCDAMGFLVMDEAFDEWENPKNKWSTGHNVYPPKHQGYYEDFPQWHEADLTAMIRRDRNHPSVILWSIGNEIDYPNDPYCHPMFTAMTGNNDANKPEKERQYDTNKPNAERLTVICRQLAELVRREDATRPVTLAAAFPELSARLGFLEPLDVAGYNYKEHLYEQDHREYPDKPLLGSENSHSFEAWQAVTEHPYISGQFLWTGIDYLGEARGWPVHGSLAGILTTAGYPKPEYYRRKSFWSEELTMQLATRIEEPDAPDWLPMSESWNYTPGAKVTVKCYANLPQGSHLVLYCNGRETGSREHYDADGAFVFSVSYEPGSLSAACISEGGEILCQCSLVTSGEPEHLQVRVWQEADAVSGAAWESCARRKGYLYQLLMDLQDQENQLVTARESRIRVQVSGAGELAGLDNGDLADVTSFTSDSRYTHSGRLAVYIRRIDAGEIRVTITALNRVQEVILSEGKSNS